MCNFSSGLRASGLENARRGIMNEPTGGEKKKSGGTSSKRVNINKIV